VLLHKFEPVEIKLITRVFLIIKIKQINLFRYLAQGKRSFLNLHIYIYINIYYTLHYIYMYMYVQKRSFPLWYLVRRGDGVFGLFGSHRMRRQSNIMFGMWYLRATFHYHVWNEIKFKLFEWFSMFTMKYANKDVKQAVEKTIIYWYVNTYINNTAIVNSRCSIINVVIFNVLYTALKLTYIFISYLKYQYKCITAPMFDEFTEMLTNIHIFFTF